MPSSRSSRATRSSIGTGTSDADCGRGQARASPLQTAPRSGSNLISAYPFDGATPSALFRAADQALYAAKSAGKDQIASFRDVVGATACSTSKVDGDFLVDAMEHALREVWLADEPAYRVSDFPLTAETLRTGRPRAVSFLDAEVDPAEAFILRELSMNALLMVPLRVGGRSWGLVEVYERRLRRFTEDDVGIAQLLATQAERRLEVVRSERSPRPLPRVYELPPDGGEPRRIPRIR